MLAQLTRFVSDHANQAIIVAVLYLVADDVLVFIADVRKRGWDAIRRSPTTTLQLIAEDVSTKVAIAVAGAAMLAFFAGGANPQQAALDALATGLSASAVVVLNDIRIRFAALFLPGLPAPAAADRRIPAAALVPFAPPPAKP
ncbi:MAG TPA: hypothetical protein VGU71_22510 [Candidatus Dormibacteraeota bacterium]|nr:hypothetical protein [Candidatus Dormibacteraeota bacterium]